MSDIFIHVYLTYGIKFEKKLPTDFFLHCNHRSHGAVFSNEYSGEVEVKISQHRERNFLMVRQVFLILVLLLYGCCTKK